MKVLCTNCHTPDDLSNLSSVSGQWRHIRGCPGTAWCPCCESWQRLEDMIPYDAWADEGFPYVCADHEACGERAARNAQTGAAYLEWLDAERARETDTAYGRRYVTEVE